MHWQALARPGRHTRSATATVDRRKDYRSPRKPRAWVASPDLVSYFY
jgi:hypothetical protein